MSAVAAPLAESAEGIGRRAAGAVIAVALRTVIIRAGGLIGTAVLTHLMLPSQYGVVAFGLTIVMSATFLADAGLGAALVRRTEPPEREDLQTVVGMQLGVTLALAIVVAGVAAPLGKIGGVTALMMASLPLLSFRTPAVIVLERELRFAELARVEVAETVVFYAWGIGAVALGFGAWGLASAAIVRAVCGCGLMFALVREARVMPRLDRERARTLLGFGTRFQAVTLAQTGRDQGLNVVTAAIGGIGMLALWSLSLRLLQLPFLLFSSLWRVSFPAMAQLRKTTSDAAVVLRDGVSFTALGTGVLMCALVGSAPAIVPAVFGSQWDDAALVLPALCLGLQVSGPVSVSASGFLYAEGDSGCVLRATLVSSAVWLGLAAAVVGPFGLAGLGAAGLVGAAAESLVLARGVRRHQDVGIVAPALRPALAAAVAAAAGWLLAAQGDPTLLRGITAGAVSVVGFAVVALVVDRRNVLAAVQVLRGVIDRKKGTVHA